MKKSKTNYHLPVFIVIAVIAMIYIISMENQGFLSEKSDNIHSYRVEVMWLSGESVPIIHYDLPGYKGSDLMDISIWFREGTFEDKGFFSIQPSHSVFIKLYIDGELIKEASPVSGTVSLKYNYSEN